MIMYIILACARESLAQNVPCVKNAATLVCVGYNFHIRQPLLIVLGRRYTCKQIHILIADTVSRLKFLFVYTT